MTPTATDKLYMSIAHRVAAESYCQRKQVGAILALSSGILLPGFNGAVSGLPNVCETDDGDTLTTTLHAESNVYSKALRAGVSTIGGTLYVTLSPCIECAKLTIQAGITRVVYAERYRCDQGLTLLSRCGIVTEQINEGTHHDPHKLHRPGVTI
jgi:dCMP deaminase